MPVSHQDYSAELSSAYPNRGHPLADPQPGFDQHGSFLPPVEIGDVGYIQHNHGYFVRLFNVHLRPGRDGQPHRVGLPKDFVELERGELRRVKNNARLFKSNSVTCKGVIAGASGPLVVPVGGNLTFSTAQQRGAILVTPGPEPITSIDVLSEDIKRYKRYTVTHMSNWIPFFKAKGLKLEDIVLVTGLDRTASWATAAFAGSELDAGFGLNVQYAAAGGAHFAAQLTWHQDTAVMTNSTPTATGQEGPNTELNQTVFIRRLRAKRRFWGVAMKANAEPHDPDVGEGSDDDDMAMEESPERGEFVDSLTPILDYILAHSDAPIALAHDEDMPRYMDNLKTGVSRQQSPYPIDTSMDGVGMLHSVNVTKAKKHPPVGSAIYFLNAKGKQERGTVLSHGAAQPDKTPVVSVKVEGTGSIVVLPDDQVHPA